MNIYIPIKNITDRLVYIA